MAKKISLRIVIILLFLLYAAFAVVYWKMALNRTKEAVAEHSRVIAESLWDLDEEGSVEYLNVVVNQLGYEHLAVTEPNGRVFTEINPEKPGRLDQALIRMKLIPLVPVSADITYNGDIIGVISVVWRGRVIYPYTYVFLVVCLVLVVILLYDRVLNEKYKLESRVVKRTGELRKAMEDLRKSEENFRLLADTSPVAISIFSGERYLYVNSSWPVKKHYRLE